VSVKAILSIRAWRQGELHQMGDALLPTTSMWILHTERFSLCILIQSPEAFPLLVLGFERLGTARRGGRRSRARRRALLAGGGILKELLGGGEGGTDLILGSERLGLG
jgi:hypothetical protein